MEFGRRKLPANGRRWKPYSLRQGTRGVSFLDQTQPRSRGSSGISAKQSVTSHILDSAPCHSQTPRSTSSMSGEHLVDKDMGHGLSSTSWIYSRREMSPRNPLTKTPFVCSRSSDSFVEP